MSLPSCYQFDQVWCAAYSSLVLQLPLSLSGESEDRSLWLVLSVCHLSFIPLTVFFIFFLFFSPHLWFVKTNQAFGWTETHKSSKKNKKHQNETVDLFKTQEPCQNGCAGATWHKFFYGYMIYMIHSGPFNVSVCFRWSVRLAEYSWF